MVTKKGPDMLYHFASFPDGTEISYSEVLHDKSNDRDQLRIFIERWDEKISDFDTLEFYLPSLRISKQKGFSNQEIQQHLQHINKLGGMLFECAKEEEQSCQK